VRIVVCAKEVLDPDAVNNFALEGKLVIGEDGKSLTQTSIPRLMNAYDEQAIEAALRIRDAGSQLTITVVSVGPKSADMLKHAASLGADEIVQINAGDVSDYHVVAQILAAYIKKSGSADLVLCGRQASDDDQGVVPAMLGELLGAPVITVARAVVLENATVRVTRVTPDGDEIVEARCPAVVTISNELGTPRYPTMQAKLKARKMQPTVVAAADIGLASDALAPRVEMVKQFVPTVRGECEFLTARARARSHRRSLPSCANATRSREPGRVTGWRRIRSSCARGTRQPPRYRARSPRC
jgi:electron transfer flavoprotein beta subunit